MSRITIQMGHCFRKSGATGTHREQEFASTVGPKLEEELRLRGHTVKVILADAPSPYPACDVFIALHCDGSTDPLRRGASVGYPSSSSSSKHAQMAKAWKAAHQALGFPGGFLPDNYTSGLRYYYGFGNVNATYEYLAEHGTTTNKADELWLFANIDKCVRAHVDAIGSIVGHPIPVFNPVPQPPEDEMQFRAIRRIEDNATALVAPGYFRHVDGPRLSAAIAAGLTQQPSDDVNWAEWDIVKETVLNSESLV